jgi:aromatic-L-amino-acid decarboxylase
VRVRRSLRTGAAHATVTPMADASQAQQQLDELRDTAHTLVDMLVDYLATVEQRPVFPAGDPAAVAALFDEPLPREPQPAERITAEIRDKLLPWSTHVGHPGYLGLITPSPTPMGALGDFVASVLNQNAGAYSIGPAAVSIERLVNRWLTRLLGLGPAAGGHLTSGGMMANFEALKLARDFASDDRAQHDGARVPMAVYVSEERHVSVDKAVDCVGLGRAALRVLPTDDQFRLRLDLLEQAIAADRAAGVRPACLVAMGGSTNTGAIDPLPALREIADRERMWLHVDAAYGGGLAVSARRAGLLAGIERADSVTIDPHKWFYAPIDAGAILVRDSERLIHSYGLEPPYLRSADRARFDHYVHSFEQSRRFRALKLWMSFKRYGVAEIGRWVDDNCDLAERLYQLGVQGGDLEPAVRPTMSAVCLRWLGSGELTPDASAALHREAARRIQDAGRFWISTTVLKGRSYFRINPVNFRTRPEHMDALAAEIRATCQVVAREQGSA